MTMPAAIANLQNDPTWFVGEQLREGSRHLSALTRSEAVKTMIERTSVIDTGEATEVAP